MQYLVIPCYQRCKQETESWLTNLGITHRQRGDLIVFKTPDAAKILEPEAERKKEQYYIKRVIGKPGQSCSRRWGYSLYR